MMGALHKMGSHGEVIAVAGAAFSWSAWLHGILDPLLLILSVLLTLCSLILVVPKVICQVKKWIPNKPKTKS